MHSFKSDEFKIRVLTKDDAEEYNALLRYAFQVTEADLAETGWKDDEIKQSKFPVLERADVLGCFNIIDNKEELVAQFAVYPLDMNIYGERYEVGFVTSVCTYPEYTGHGLMKKLMRKSLTRMRDSNKSFALLYPYSIPLYRGLGWEIISNKMTYVIKDRQIPTKLKEPGYVRRGMTSSLRSFILTLPRRLTAVCTETIWLGRSTSAGMRTIRWSPSTITRMMNRVAIWCILSAPMSCTSRNSST